MTHAQRRPGFRAVHRRAALAAALLLVAGLAGSAPVGATVRHPGPQAPAATAAFNPGAINLVLTQIPGSFSSPVLLTHAGDGSGRLFVVEQTGKVRIVTSGGSVLPAAFLDISGSISTGGERGLLGLAFHPNFATNKKLYINATNPGGDTVINEYTVGADPNRVATSRRILKIDQPFANHNGGHLAFGKDGFLYIGMGDGGSAGDPGNRAQSLNSLLGKMLRIDVNGKTGSRQYRIPSTNPYVGRSGLDEIFARGLRNPWRFSFDSATGRLWIGDVGQGRWEEINRSYPDGGRSTNYGWRVMEGRHCYRPSSGCSRSGKYLPVVEYPHSVSGSDNCSVTGGYVYRGTAQPLLTGGYLFGDFCSGRIWGIDANVAAPATPVLLRDTDLNISSFGEDQARNLYVLDLGGAIYRLSATPK